MQLYYAVTIEQREGTEPKIYITYIEQSLWDTRPLDMKNFDPSKSNRDEIDKFINSLNLDFLIPIEGIKGIYEYKTNHNTVINHSDFIQNSLIQSTSFGEFLASL